MIFNSLKNSALKIIFSPWTLLIFATVSLFGLLMGNIVGWAVEKPVIDLILYYDALAQSNFLFILLTQYPLELFTIIVSGIVGLVISATGLLSLARIAKGESIVDAINESVLNWKKSLGLAVFFVAAIIVLVGIFFVLSAITGLLSGVIPDSSYLFDGIIFPLVFFIILLFAMVKLGFVIPAFVENDLRKAVQKSWEFTNKRFLGAFLLMIILIVIIFAFEIVGQNISLMIDPQYELVVTSVADIISTTFIGLALAYYYFAKKS